jgi:AcrR family transcriptional regulator
VTGRSTRAQQRLRTEEKILTVAQQMFADVGYDRTTIRAVASAAGVDAGLVMHYFGSKDQLFARAAAVPVDELAGDGVVEALLASLADRLDGEPVASLAVMRSMLTNADAAERYRAAAGPQLDRITAGIAGADAELRASLLSAIVHGVLIERYLLRLGRLADASPEQIVALLRPCFEALAPTSADGAGLGGPAGEHRQDPGGG